jgi:hypothetical protein
MGGLFGLGKDKKAAKGGSDRRPLPDQGAAGDVQSTRKSRKVIAAKPTGAPRAPGRPASRSGDPAPVELGPTGAHVEAPPAIDMPLELGDAPVSRPATGPVAVSAAPAPVFAGTIASGSRNGPSRTGDAVLIEFLQSKANPPLLTPEQAAQAKGLAEAENIAFDSACVRLAFFTEDQLVTVLTQECWVPHLKVDKYEIRKKALDTVTRDDAVHYGVFPVDKLGSLLTLAMVNPLDSEAIRALEHKTGLDIKKVVATRSEISQGIEKYYSGNVQVKDTSRSFVQDVEPRSVTQMMSKVGPSAGPGAAPLLPIPAVPPPTASAPATESIVADIQDIDDLLGAEISPAIVEPIMAEPMTLDDEPAITPAARGPRPEPALELEPTAGTDTEAIQAPAPVDTSALVPNRPVAPPAPALAPLPTIAPVAKPAPAPAVAPAAGANRPAGATSRFQAGSAAGSAAAALVQVTEDEFRYAISHGRSRLFERWVALQTRNRIINGQPVERELEPVLAGLFEHGRRA